MEVRLQDDLMVLNDKEMNLTEVVDKLANLAASQIVEYFNSINLKLPRVLNIAALRGVLNSKVVVAKTLNLSDEMMYRLRFYPDFSEYQLQAFYRLVKEDGMDVCYKQNLFKVILMNANLLNLSDEQVTNLLNIVALPYEDFDTFENLVLPLFYDFNKDFDGIRKETIVNVMRKSATSQDIRDLGKKYDISIPKRLKRDEMQVLIEEGLRKQHKLTVEMKEKLDKLPIINLQRVAKQNGIKVSVDLKKEDLIAYLLNEVDKAKFDTRPRLKYATDLGDGFVFDLAYVMEIEEIEEFVKEEDGASDVKVEEPEVVKEVKVVEPVKEEKVVVEEKVEEPEVVEEKVEETKVVEEKVEEAKVVEPVKEEPVVKEVIVEKQCDKTEIIELVTKCLIDVIKEVRPILTQPKEPAPAPVINIYNNENKEPVPAEVKVEETPNLVTYQYNNFDEQVSPKFDSKVANIMANSDYLTLKKNIETVNAELVNKVPYVAQPQFIAVPYPCHLPNFATNVGVAPEVVEKPEEKPAPVVEETVTEEVVEKTPKKRLTQKERNQNMKAARLAKKNKKLGIVEEVPTEEVPSGNGTRFVIPAQVIPANQTAPSQVEETVPANIVIMTEGGVPTSVPVESPSNRQVVVNNKIEEKNAKKALKKQAKIEKNQLIKNRTKMNQALRTGFANGCDPVYFDQTMRLQEYKLKVRENAVMRSESNRRFVGTILKTILIIVGLLVAAWIVVGIIYGFNDNPDENNFFYQITKVISDFVRDIRTNFGENK